MACKRSASPGPQNLMPEIMELIAEPNSNDSIENDEVVPCKKFKREGNNDYCHICTGGGELICCNNCPRSYHASCHYPKINKLPADGWFCMLCVYIDNDEYKVHAPFSNEFDINELVKDMMNLENECNNQVEHMTEIPLRTKYNSKLYPPPQFPQKTDRCLVCKSGLIKGRLVCCCYCKHIYHINCLDPPVRSWDNGTRWICSGHNNYYNLLYPEYFSPGSQAISDALALRRLQFHVATKRVLSYFKIPSYVNAMYKKPAENIPITQTKNNSFNILCEVASFELESLNNSSNQINNENTSNDITEKILQSFTKLQNINLLPNQPNAFLTCLTLPIQINVRNEPLGIGISANNGLCLQEYDYCQFISDDHATITYDEKLGDYLVKNHSIHGIIVDNVSYYGHQKPSKVIDSIHQKEIFSHVDKFLDKRRSEAQKHKLIEITPIKEFNRVIMKYVTKIRHFDYISMAKYCHDNEEVKDNYLMDECKCIKRFIPEDSYTGEALLRDNSLLSIGCLKFKFTFNIHEDISLRAKMPKTTQDDTVGDQSPNEPCLRMQSKQPNHVGVLRNTETEIPLITLDDDCTSNSFDNVYSETTTTDVVTVRDQSLNKPCLRMQTQQPNCADVLRMSRGSKTDVSLITIYDHESDTFNKPCLRMQSAQPNHTGVLRGTPLVTNNDNESNNMCSGMTTSKQDVIMENQSFNEPCLRMQTDQDNRTGILKRTEKVIPLVTIDDHESNMFNMCSEMPTTKQDVIMENQSFNEPCLRMQTDQDNRTGILKRTEKVIPLVTIDDHESNMFNMCSEMPTTKQDVIMENQSFNEPCLRMQTDQDNRTGILKRTEKVIPLVTIDDHESNMFNMCSEMPTTKQDVIMENQSFNEPCLRIQTDQDNRTGILRRTEKVIPLVTIDNHESNENNEQYYTSTSSSGNLEYNDETQFAYNNHSSQNNTPYTTQCNSMNNVSGMIQSYDCNDLIQEVEMEDDEEIMEDDEEIMEDDEEIMEDDEEIMEDDEEIMEDDEEIMEDGEEIMEDDEEIMEEEFVYGTNYAEADQNTEQDISDIQDWVNEEGTVNYNSNMPGPSGNLPMPSAINYLVCNNPIEYNKTEHLYCTNTPPLDEIIVISDDEDYKPIQEHEE